MPRTNLYHHQPLTHSLSSRITISIASSHDFSQQTRPKSTRSTSPRTHRAQPTNLESFLSHARRTDLSPQTRVFQGTVYEYAVQAALSRLGLVLHRRGGRGDRGIDLAGTWHLPASPLLPAVDPKDLFHGRPARRVAAYVQCKSLRRKTGPSVLRELEGAFHAFRPSLPYETGSARPSVDRDWSLDDNLESEDNPESEEYLDSEKVYGPLLASTPQKIGILATRTPATKGILDALRTASVPLAFAMVSRAGTVAQFLWNSHAARLDGLAGVQVSTRYISGRTSLSLLIKDVEAFERASSTGSEEGGSSLNNEDAELEVESEEDPDALHQEIVLTSQDETWDFPLPLPLS